MLRRKIEFEVRDPAVDVLIEETRLLLEEGRTLLRQLRRSRDSTSKTLDAVKKMLEHAPKAKKPFKTTDRNPTSDPRMTASGANPGG